jgi:hypothetical protein
MVRLTLPAPSQTVKRTAQRLRGQEIVNLRELVDSCATFPSEMPNPANPPSPADQSAVAFVQRLVAWMTNHRATVSRYGRFLQVAAGLILLALGWHMGDTHLHLIREGKREEGRIIGYQPRSFRSSRSETFSSTGYMPVVEFSIEGRTVRFEDWLGSSVEGPLNAHVTVLYDPVKPYVAMIDRPIWNWLPWAPISTVGLFLLSVGITGLLRSPA